MGGGLGAFSPSKFRCSEIASEAILGQKQSRSSYIHGLQNIASNFWLTLNFHERFIRAMCESVCILPLPSVQLSCSQLFGRGLGTTETGGGQKFKVQRFIHCKSVCSAMPGSARGVDTRPALNCDWDRALCKLRSI